MTTINLGDVTLTRVLYLEAAIDPDAGGLTPDQVRAVPWGEPTWADDGQMRLASCVWVVRSGGRHVVVDPAGNLDDILHDPGSTGHHQKAYRAAFAAAGIPIESVDTVLLSHIESIGLTAVRDGDGWTTFFPNARVLISDTAKSDFEEHSPPGDIGAAFTALFAAGVIDTYLDGEEIVPGVRAEWTGMHNPGHCAFHVGDDATFVGHLAVSPLHFATGPCAPQHADPNGVWRWLNKTKANGRVLIGPLWPSPGAMRFTDNTFQPVGVGGVEQYP
jgi:glyoxylase-like metal-dependent hydrolase (beta-lactamase superfamily II)